MKIASVRGTTFTDGGLNRNTPYIYSVRGPGGTTSQITLTPGSVTTSTPTTTTPTTTTPTTPTPTTTTPKPTTSTPTTTTTPPAGTGAPSNLRKASQTSSSIHLTWNGSPTTGYDILRGEDGVKIATVTGTHFTDIGLLPNTTYVYAVRGAGVTTPQVRLSIS